MTSKRSGSSWAIHMAVMGRRSHIVSFRVSEEAYEAAQEACRASGVRSMSELARRATEAWVDFGGSTNDALLAKVWELQDEVRRLESETRRLAGKLTAGRRRSAGPLGEMKSEGESPYPEAGDDVALNQDGKGV